MAYINNKMNGLIKPISKHIIQVEGLDLTYDGFILYANETFILGNYKDYTNVYRIIDEDKKIYQYSNNGSTYIKDKGMEG